MLSGDHDISMISTINGQSLAIVDHFDYLGRTLSKDADDLNAVESRIGKAWSAFQKNCLYY